jgi:hypothetical protein
LLPDYRQAGIQLSYVALKWCANLEKFKLLTRFQAIAEYSNFVTMFNHEVYKVHKVWQVGEI